jgi:hypothetical protein
MDIFEKSLELHQQLGGKIATEMKSALITPMSSRLYILPELRVLALKFTKIKKMFINIQ